MSKRKVAETPIDPTSAGVPIKLAGVTYTLCFDLAALAEAEDHFASEGHEVNLLMALPVLNIGNVRRVFPCALHKHQPNITFLDAQRMITLDNLHQIANAIAAAWLAAAPEAKPEEKKSERPGQP